MKLFKLVVLISLLTLFVTGCNINSESPEQLIKEKPIYNETKKVIYDELDKALSINSKLLLPENSHDVGYINEVDLDKNGVDEVIVFEKKEDPNGSKNEVGFLVLSKNPDSTYMEMGHLLQAGESIEYANFHDLNGDGNLEIVTLIKTEAKTNVYIYEFKDKKINLIYELNPTWIKDRKNITDTKIKVGYINDDELLDILLLNFNPSSNKLYVSLINLKEEVQVIDFVEFDNVRSLQNLYATLGNISSNQVGVVLDIPISNESNYYITQILYMENDKLIKAFEEDDKKIRKNSYIPPTDINNDKVIEIPMDNSSSNMYSIKSYANVSWYRWNGKKDEESALSFNCQIYYNYQYNFKLLMPDSLVNKTYIDQEYISEENVAFKFLYNDVITSESKNLFTINVTPKNTVEDSKNLNTTNGVILGESLDYTFTLYLNDTEQLEKLNINADGLRKYFSLLY